MQKVICLSVSVWTYVWVCVSSLKQCEFGLGDFASGCKFNEINIWSGSSGALMGGSAAAPA